jgi:hypothetical protein
MLSGAGHELLVISVRLGGRDTLAKLMYAWMLPPAASRSLRPNTSVPAHQCPAWGGRAGERDPGRRARINEVAGFAERATDHQHDEQIDRAVDAAERHIGRRQDRQGSQD